MIELHDHKIKRLKMRSMRRGIKEMDLILSHFAQATLDQMTEEELVNYDLLLAENDHDLYSWVTGAAAAPPEFAPLIAQIVAGLQVQRS
jgi:antitoxin CptB